MARSMVHVAPRFALIPVVILLASGCHGPTDHPYKIEHKYSVADPQFTRTVGSLLGPPLIQGNSIKPLVNVDQMFPAMLDAIKSAEKTINIETFVYSTGQVGQQFADALTERAKAGVQVRIMLDGYGANSGVIKY